MGADMECVYRGFDGLDMAFHGRLPEAIIEALAEAKALAKAAYEPVSAEIAGVPVLVKPTGRGGGFEYSFSTGEDGADWACMGANVEGGRWMLTASAKSAMFVQHGASLEAARDQFAALLKAWHFEPTRSDEGHFESVARVDFAMDFVEAAGDPFTLDPAMIASKGKKSGYLEGASAHWSGRRVTGATVGKMPNRQVTIYDKTADIKAKGKDYWWQVWGLDPECGQRVWRVELRAAKKFLRDTWKVRTFEDLQAAVADMMADTLDKVRLVVPDDSNITRCSDAPLWRRVREAIASGFKGLFNGLCPGVVKEAVLGRLDARLRGMLRGCFLTHAAVSTSDMGFPETKVTGVKAFVERTMQSLLHEIEADTEVTIEHVAKARNRYRLLRIEDWRERQVKPMPEWLAA